MKLSSAHKAFDHHHGCSARFNNDSWPGDESEPTCMELWWDATEGPVEFDDFKVVFPGSQKNKKKNFMVKEVLCVCFNFRLDHCVCVS